MTSDFELSILKDPAFAEFNRFIGDYKFGDPVVLFFRATESFVNCEILNRRAERAAALEVSRGYGEYHDRLAMLHNAQGLRRLQGARKSIAQAIELYPKVIEKEDVLVSEEEMKGILADYDHMIKDQVLEMDLSRQEAREVWNEYANARKALDAGKMKGLIDYCSSKLAELTDARTDLGKGRQPHSPLPWWKILVIAVALAVSIFSVVYCYKKKNCEWVWRMVSAIGGSLLQILKSGC